VEQDQTSRGISGTEIGKETLGNGFGIDAEQQTKEYLTLCY
jgi:hypothetical protein